MAQHCRKIATLAPWKRLLIQNQYATPIRNAWNYQGPSDFRSLFKDIDRTVEKLEKEFVDNFPFRGIAPRTIPIEGVQQRGDTFRLNIDVDGFKPNEIKLSLKNNVLTIHAIMDRKAEDGSKYHQEFVRELTLPGDVDPADLTSYLGSNGILRVEAAYKLNPEEKPMEIPVSRN